MSDDIPQDQVEAARIAFEAALSEETGAETDEEISAADRAAQRRIFAEVIAAVTPLIAAVEREKLAAWMILNSIATGHGDTIEDLIWALTEHINRMDARFESAAAVERERCAALCDATAVQQEQIALTSGDRWLSECMHRHAGQTAQRIAKSIRSVKGAVT